jgi:hypothetical protein
VSEISNHTTFVFLLHYLFELPSFIEDPRNFRNTICVISSIVVDLKLHSKKFQ